MSDKPQSYSVTEHYAAIGYVASAWGAFEQVLQREIWTMAGIEGGVGACITSQIGMSGRLMDALIAICRIRGADKKVLAALNALVEPTADLARQRNRAVHDAWGFSGEKLPYRLELSAVKKLKMEAVEMPTEALISLAKKMLAHTEQFEHVMTKMRRELLALPEKEP